MTFKASFWLKFSIVNLLLVAVLGVLMRYKIGFEFPHFNQKSLQHAHSHFAFAGWVTHTIMTLMISFLHKNAKLDFSSKPYLTLLIGNLICSYGMFFSFIYQGYGSISITFSTLTIFISYLFTYFFIRDLKKTSIEQSTQLWFKGALFFNVMSSIGTFYLAYMMATKNVIQNHYLSSIYYYLHFQYNGWFLFACLGFVYLFLELKDTENKNYKRIFYWFFISCIPTYFLSILWAKLPVWVFVVTVLATLLQTLAWLKLVLLLKARAIKFLKNTHPILRIVFVCVCIAMSLKIVFQLLSTIPSLSQLAFGFRPIVIAYLHLVLLALISLFLLFNIYVNNLLLFNRRALNGLKIILIGVLLNEIVLAIQGTAALSYTRIPFVNEGLFLVSLCILLGTLILCLSFKKRQN
ncbi:MAG: hypothetical protein R2790_08785 [Flavobacterium haoranii]